MFAIILTGGKQYKVDEGDIIFVEKLGVEEGDEVKFDKVLAVSNDAGFTACRKGRSEALRLFSSQGGKCRIVRFPDGRQLLFVSFHFLH